MYLISPILFYTVFNSPLSTPFFYNSLVHPFPLICFVLDNPALGPDTASLERVWLIMLGWCQTYPALPLAECERTDLGEEDGQEQDQS